MNAITVWGLSKRYKIIWLNVVSKSVANIIVSNVLINTSTLYISRYPGIWYAKVQKINLDMLSLPKKMPVR